MAIKGFPFEKSAKDKEPKGMREGSKREEAYDRRQARSAPAKKAPVRRGSSRGG